MAGRRLRRVSLTRSLVPGSAIAFAKSASWSLKSMAWRVQPGTRQPPSPCYHCVYPESGDFEETACAEMGVFAPLVGIVGSLQAAEALKLLVNADGAEMLCGRLLTIDAKTMQFNTLKLRRDVTCTVCGGRR